MVFPVSWKCRSYKFIGNSSPWEIHLYAWRVFWLQRCPKRNGIEIEIWIQWWRFLLYMDNHFSFTVRISMNQRSSILVLFVDWILHASQTLANQWLSNYHTGMISSNILSLGSFFSQHQTFDTLWFQLHYTLTP